MAISLYRWPPIADFVLCSHYDDDGDLQIWVHQGGWMSVRFASGTIQRTQTFARIVFDSPLGLFMVAATASEDPGDLCINGVEIPRRDSPSTSRSVLVPTNALPTAFQTKLALVTADVPSTATEEEALFIRKLHDVQERVGSSDAYIVLQASALLRHLLLDDLWHLANKRVRADAVFTTINFKLPIAKIPGLAPKTHWRILSPPDGIGTGFLTLSLDEFLSAPILTTEGLTASVRDVIAACANVKGGVHFGAPKGKRVDNERALLENDKVFGVFGWQASIEALRSICKITVLALQATALAIQKGR